MSDTNQQSSFEDAADQQQRGIVGEFFGFMKENAKWWLLPFLIVFALLALIVILGATGAAPFLYTLF